jgi:KDO2-lipid IV(A) lauroyltransferase
MYYLFEILYFLAKKRILSKFWWLLYYIDFVRKPIVFKNLDIAFKEKSKKEKIKIAKEFYKNFATFFEDTIYINENPKELENIEIINQEEIQNAIESKKPIIIMSAHFGNWEIAPRIITKKFIPMAAIMREIDNPKINEFFVKIRSNSGVKVIYRKKAAKEMLKTLLKEKRALGILIDQYTRNKNAVVVNFFKPTKFNPAISKIAKTTKAIVIPTFSYKKNGKYVLEFKKSREFTSEDTIESFTQWQADVIVEMIKKHPSQYYWFHNRWKD